MSFEEISDFSDDDDNDDDDDKNCVSPPCEPTNSYVYFKNTIDRPRSNFICWKNKKHSQEYLNLSKAVRIRKTDLYGTN